MHHSIDRSRELNANMGEVSAAQTVEKSKHHYGDSAGADAKNAGLNKFAAQVAAKLCPAGIKPDKSSAKDR